MTTKHTGRSALQALLAGIFVILTAAPAARAAITLNFFPATTYSANTTAMNASLGVSTFALDDFSKTALLPGLSISLAGYIPATTLTALAAVYNQNTLPSACYNFDGVANLGIASWTGATAVVNTASNAVGDCFSASGTSQTITFNYPAGTRSLGIGLANFQSLDSSPFPVTNHELFVNGIDLGVLETLAGNNWSSGIKLNTYLRIDATDGSLITSVAFENLDSADVLGLSDLAIQRAATTTTLTASSKSVTTGTSVTFVAKVKENLGNGVPTGSITFQNGAVVLGKVTLNSSGHATFTTTSLPAGSDSINAVYGGDTGNEASNSAAVMVTVKVLVPNVVGLTQSAATTALSNAGLTLGTLTQVSSATVPAGSVVSENPAAASAVAAGVAVNLSISTGPPPAVTLSASALSFANQAVNTSSAHQTVTVTNSGAGKLLFTSISLTGTQAHDFALSKTCGATLAAGASCTISVAFTPILTGPKTSNVSIADNASGSPHVVALSGTGVSSP
jgi:hypothetical protein